MPPSQLCGELYVDGLLTFFAQALEGLLSDLWTPSRSRRGRTAVSAEERNPESNVNLAPSTEN